MVISLFTLHRQLKSSGPSFSSVFWNVSQALSLARIYPNPWRPWKLPQFLSVGSMVLMLMWGRGNTPEKKKKTDQSAASSQAPPSCLRKWSSPQTPHDTEWSLVYFQFLWPFYLCLWEIPDVTRLSYTVGCQSQPTLLKLNSNFVLDICPSLNCLSFVRLQTLPSPQRPQASEGPVIALDGFPLQLSHHSSGSLGPLDSFPLLFCLVLEDILLQ